MYKLNQRGAIQFLIVIILLAGLVAGVFLVQRTQIFKPKAGGGPSGPIVPESSFTLKSNHPQPYSNGRTFAVSLYPKTDVDFANLFVAKLTFPANLVQVESISYPSIPNTLVSDYVELHSDNQAGTISIVASKPNPGVKTYPGNDYGPIASIAFRVIASSGSGQIYITPESAIYSNSNNINLLTAVRPFDFTLGIAPSSSPTFVPTSSPTSIPSTIPSPSTSPAPGNGDGNNDGKINLVDMSVLLTDFNRTGSIRRGIDMNGDGRVNVFDFSLMRTFLIQRGVIRG